MLNIGKEEAHGRRPLAHLCLICISGTNEWGNMRPSSVRTTACKTLVLVKAIVQCTTHLDVLKQMLLLALRM